MESVILPQVSLGIALSERAIECGVDLAEPRYVRSVQMGQRKACGLRFEEHAASHEIAEAFGRHARNENPPLRANRDSAIRREAGQGVTNRCLTYPHLRSKRARGELLSWRHAAADQSAAELRIDRGVETFVGSSFDH
jgi:hypothetical protein